MGCVRRRRAAIDHEVGFGGDPEGADLETRAAVGLDGPVRSSGQLEDPHDSTGGGAKSGSAAGESTLAPEPAWATDDLQPDLVILLDLPVGEAAARLGADRDRFEEDFGQAGPGFQGEQAVERWPGQVGVHE